MKYFTRSASQQLSNWKGGSRWDSLWRRYGQELARIRANLTPGWRELADMGMQFHDTSIFAIERPREAEVILRVDMGASRERFCMLQFLGVCDARIPESVIGDSWLYEEVHLTETGRGDLQVLFHKSELQIVAIDVGVFKNYDEPL